MRKYLKWFMCCLVIFMISIFLHECGHGLANAIAGIPCSTGFNRVGDIYKYPREANFRAAYSHAEDVLLDFGVPCTLIMAIIGTVVFYKSRSEKLQYAGAAFSATNSILRLFPCLWVVLTPLLTGEVHIEDEYETGRLIAEMTGSEIWLYVPALISIVISIICIVLMIRKVRQRKVRQIGNYILMVFLSFFVGMVFANVLDNFLRINWPAL